MTPSAARGILEAILWKPAIQWHITQIDVLNPIKWESVRRNELGYVMSQESKGFFVDELKSDGRPKYRQQKASVILRDVAYTIHAHFELTAKASAEDTVIKFTEMFLRRAEKGQNFHRPYLGCREFAANFVPIRNGQPVPLPIQESRDLGYMLRDVHHDNATYKYNQHHCNEKCTPQFFIARLVDGRITVPPLGSTEVRS